MTLTALLTDDGVTFVNQIGDTVGTLDPEQTLALGAAISAHIAALTDGVQLEYQLDAQRRLQALLEADAPPSAEGGQDLPVTPDPEGPNRPLPDAPPASEFDSRSYVRLVTSTEDELNRWAELAGVEPIALPAYPTGITYNVLHAGVWVQSPPTDNEH